MITGNFDPLDAQPSSEILAATLKREIKNILKSYTGWYDPFCEMLQNALDAVEHRKNKEKEYLPQIWVDINLKENTICVTDNGIGFSEDQFRTFLAPNVSYKGTGDRGNKGVGATYLGYGFNFLQIGTRNEDFTFVGTLKNAREWVEDTVGTQPRAKIQESEALHAPFSQIDCGSMFCLKLVGNHIRPKDLAWTGASTAEQWEVILKTKTPLGGIYCKEPILSRCHLRVVDSGGGVTEKDLADCTYLYPHVVVSSCAELKKIREAQKDLIMRGKDPSRLPDGFFRLNGLYNFWSYSDFTDSAGEFKAVLSDEEKDLANKYKICVYGFFGYSTDIWDYYNDQMVKLRKGSRILKGGLQLATNGMPQGDLLIIPLTRNTGYQNVTHVVIHFQDADPDLGRKGFQPELQELGQRISVAVVKRFQDWKKHLKTETGAPPDIAESKNIHDWIREQEDHEKNKPLQILRSDVFLPTMEPSLTSQPLNEQDVVALFNQLLAGGVIRGIKVMATSQHLQYDGVFRLILRKPFDNHIFDKMRNPLGLLTDVANREFTSEPKILEYKYSFDALIEEFEKEEKRERQIDLVVAWEMGKNWSSRYDIIPLLHLDNLHHRYFHGGTHIIKNATTGDRIFPAIILSELINYINDPDKEQDYQRLTYME